MKRIIVILLLCAIMLSCLVSCRGRRRDPDVLDEPPVIENTKYNSYNGNPIRTVSEKEKRDLLISRLTNYLIEKDWVFYDEIIVEGSNSISYKIAIINSGVAPYLVSFDSADYYYMCAYYNEPDNEPGLVEPDVPEDTVDGYHDLGLDFVLPGYGSPVYQYTWVRFENPTDITEFYDGKKMVEAFQINRSFFVSNIKSENISVPDIEHFKSYKTEFVDGYNVNGAQPVSGAFISLSFVNSSPVIFCSGLDGGIPCVEIDGEYFIRIDIYEKNEKVLMEEFGYWYEYLVPLMDTERYSEKLSNGDERFYGIIGVREFTDVISNLVNNDDIYDATVPDVYYGGMEG